MISAVDGDGGPVVVSLLTCDPGPDVYELCGHSAIRIRNGRMDSVWNYGIFDFDAPNFIYRFCKGQTDYMVCGYPTEYFIPSYIRRGSNVTEQVLDLTPGEADRLRKLLQTESLPQNRVYRYNYVKDNCATRPWLRITEAMDTPPALPDTLYFPTFRAEMKHFHRNYPWYQFGIDLALGSGIDRPLDRNEDIFAPPVLAEKVASALRYDASGSAVGARPLVVRSDVLVTGKEDATLPPTPWYLTPVFAGSIMLLLSICVAFGGKRCGSLSRLWISLYFLVAGLAGCVITFLVFCSEHEATSPNVLILWLNPLQWIVGIGIWFKSWRKAVDAMSCYNIVVGVLFLIMALGGSIGISRWFAVHSGQLMNPAILLMSLCLIPLSIAILLPGCDIRRPAKVKK